jgi:phosphoribosyl isomerase A
MERSRCLGRLSGVTFTLLPAVDVADGQAVRPVQGKLVSGSTFGECSEPQRGLADPLQAALAWQDGGAEWIHLVDLDAAFSRGSNAVLLASVIEMLDTNVQLSGGIGDEASLQLALATRCARVVLSTSALRDLSWCERAVSSYGDRIAVALDVRVVEGPDRSDGAPQHRLSARGTSRDDGSLWDTLTRLDRAGCTRYVVTDVSKDGMLSGPNMELYRSVTSATTAEVIASGGVAEISDLVALAEVARAHTNLEGSIIGKALYAGRFTLREALAVVRGF